MKYKVYVTRDASVTYVAEVELPLDQIEARCGKYGFDADGLHPLEWELHDISTFDDAEAFEITQDVIMVIDREIVFEEVSLKEWSLS